jgi:hypothetical protein
MFRIRSCVYIPWENICDRVLADSSGVRLDVEKFITANHVTFGLYILDLLMLPIS